MTGLVATFLGAALWTGVIVLALAAGAALAGWRRVSRDLPMLCALVFFVVLTQYPLPDPDRFSCPMPNTDPDWMPGNSIAHIRSQIHYFGWRTVVFLDRTLIAAVLNFLLCGAIGLTLAWQGRLGTWAILGFGLGLPVMVEFTQITGTWGLFDCAYRKFDMDDLILNFAGIAAGLWWARARGWTWCRSRCEAGVACKDRSGTKGPGPTGG